ncbi:hypothetical protein BASA83_004262 [Batrachochytrium salamandrivorans]|nr:hypothetical protein BASA83_004262 [Batrachochytrium salamandrivorans]
MNGSLGVVSGGGDEQIHYLLQTIPNGSLGVVSGGGDESDPLLSPVDPSELSSDVPSLLSPVDPSELSPTDPSLLSPVDLHYCLQPILQNCLQAIPENRSSF